MFVCRLINNLYFTIYAYTYILPHLRDITWDLLQQQYTTFAYDVLGICKIEDLCEIRSLLESPFPNYRNVLGIYNCSLKYRVIFIKCAKKILF